MKGARAAGRGRGARKKQESGCRAGDFGTASREENLASRRAPRGTHMDPDRRDVHRAAARRATKP